MRTEAEKKHETVDLYALSRRLECKSGNQMRLLFRTWLWNSTVWLSYGFKRLLDLTGATLGLLVLSPFLVVIGLAIKVTSPGPIIFKQVRVGRYGRHFMFYKFRTMVTDAESQRRSLAHENQSKDGVIFKMKHDPRVTKLGRVLRKFSIDELPQLINVFLGDMSLVGPRPPLPSEVMEYTLEDRKRLDVKPGLTCIWQISGRSDVPFKRQVQLDKAYILSRGFWGDILILLKTVPAIILGRGAY